MKIRFRLIGCLCFSVLILQLTGCGSTRSLKPLGDGVHKVDLSIGGPMLDATAKAPAPYAIVGYSYGLGSKWNLEAHYHAVASLYKTFALELGASYELLEQGHATPNIMLNGRIAIATDGKRAAAFPIISPTVAYEVARFTPYIGSDFLFQFHDNDRVYTPQSIAPYIGTRYAWSSFDFGGEFKWLAANHDFTYNNLDFPTGPGNRGAFGGYLYFAYRFGGSQ